MKYILIAVFSLLFGFTQLAFAEDAKHCISVGYHKASYGPRGDSQTLTNNCSRRIHVIWCHDNPDKRFKRGVCGRKGQYYQKETVLKPGQVKQNQYSLPRSGTIYYAACFGGYYTTKFKQWKDGNYTCKKKKK